ncbi:MAG: glycosyltransferase [Bacteroidia bacterium]
MKELPMAQKVFIILSSNNIGGAEKRFVGLWQAICELHSETFACLVLSPRLYTVLQQQKDLALGINKFNEKIIQFDLTGRFKEYRKAVKNFVTLYTSPKDLLHFIGDHPLIPRLNRKQVYSITQSSLKNLNLVGRIGLVGGVFLSQITDILDPRVYCQMTSLFFLKKNKIFQTSNSYCNVELFTALPFKEKKDWLVFLGRFESMKQVKHLMDAVPVMYQSLIKNAGRDLHFYFFGHGSQEDELKKMLEEERFRGLPITLSYNPNPNEVLAHSKVFFSLQLHNNYPSRSLIEAMSAGNIPVVTDVGQTRWLAKPEFSYYVPEHFTAVELQRTVRKIFLEEEESLSSKSIAARQFVVDEHTIGKMRDYYLKLYSDCRKQN